MTPPTTALATAVATDGAHVPVLVHRPVEPVRGWLVWAHGGSWQHGSATQWAPATARLSAVSGWVVVSVDYRLAPEDPFPAAVLDLLAVLDWAEPQAEGLSVAVGGDSAGGTVAAYAALARRDTGGRVPAQVLAYPPLDPDCAGASYRESPGAFPDRAELRRAWHLWLGTKAHHRWLRPSPLDAPSLAGLAPVFLAVGDHDPVRDDVTAYAQRLRCDSVPVTLAVLPGTGHGDLLTPRGRILPALAAALTDLTATTPEPHYTKGYLS